MKKIFILTAAVLMVGVASIQAIDIDVFGSKFCRINRKTYQSAEECKKNCKGGCGYSGIAIKTCTGAECPTQTIN